MKFLKSSIYLLMKKLGYLILRTDYFETINQYEDSHKAMEILRWIVSLGNQVDLDSFMGVLRLSKSQLMQDVFVLTYSGFKEKGYFVEFGATNGIDLSNTYMLEKTFGWAGIVSEPSFFWQNDLQLNRDCIIESKAVWSSSNSRLDFLESVSPSLSTISRYKSNDNHYRKGTTYKVNTISLIDLLIKYESPKIIDYMSIDTEGSEFDILSNFDFDMYKFRVITVEHNFTSNREKIYDLLTSKGYERVMKSISSFDDWYVLDANKL